MTDFRVITGDAREVVPTLEEVDVVFTHPHYWWKKEGPREEYVELVSSVINGARAKVIFLLLGDSVEVKEKGIVWDVIKRINYPLTEYSVWHETFLDQLHFILQFKDKVDIPKCFVERTNPPKGYLYATIPDVIIRACLSPLKGKNWTVLDPFCGTGSTGKIANELGADFIGIDIEPFV